MANKKVYEWDIEELEDWLDMESSCFDGKIWINGDFIETNDDNA